MASKNCWMAWLVFLVSVLLLMTSELAAARELLGQTSKPVMNSGQGPANLVRDASCWQRELEWWQDTAVVIKWLSGVSPLRICFKNKELYISSLKKDKEIYLFNIKFFSSQQDKVGKHYKVMDRVMSSLFIVLSTLYQSSSAPLSSSSARRNSTAAARKTNQIPSCNEFVSRSQCSHNPKCRWCHSEALDDMCFTKTEAWRLPQQCEHEWRQDIAVVTKWLSWVSPYRWLSSKSTVPSNPTSTFEEKFISQQSQNSGTGGSCCFSSLFPFDDAIDENHNIDHSNALRQHVLTIGKKYRETIEGLMNGGFLDSELLGIVDNILKSFQDLESKFRVCFSSLLEEVSVEHGVGSS
ncbi:hypothetical protein EZV62_005583 [Acer yangbiense]|uniref:C3H1-type domain-containing protein n=1 Tax=Acer yangbiense TaxID=1000413 RepID=A0A5C7ING4_9ROSI|nr:hypothetical protein EZV62_005583 [Acer yangbiense]